MERLKKVGIVVKTSQEKQTGSLSQEDTTEDSLEKLERRLQALVKKKKQTSQLVEDYEKVQQKASQDKGVEK